MGISISDLTYIAGTWEGSGHAEYPTIQPIDYREELIFTLNKKDLVIHYEQRTWIKSSDERNNEPIFWESGFFIDKNNGLFDLVSAQKTGRMEILRGSARRIDKNSIELPLTSISIVNDSRMIRSGRVYTFSKNVLQYELKMSTTANVSYQRHLMGRLTKTNS